MDRQLYLTQVTDIVERAVNICIAVIKVIIRRGKYRIGQRSISKTARNV